MEKFPEDVIRAETAVGGDIEILTRDEFQETKKESYAGLFGEPKKTPVSAKRGKNASQYSVIFVYTNNLSMQLFAECRQYYEPRLESVEMIGHIF